MELIIGKPAIHKNIEVPEILKSELRLEMAKMNRTR